MAPAAACAQKNAPRKFTAIKWSNWAGVVAMNRVLTKMAALLTSRSRPPRARAARPTSRRASAGLARSALSAIARTPSFDLAHRPRRRGCRLQVADRDVGAFAGERQRDRPPHAHRAAGHERPRSGQFLDTLGTV
jgi:hypothetical protein